MFNVLFARSPRRRFRWKPALASDHTRHSVALTTFPAN